MGSPCADPVPEVPVPVWIGEPELDPEEPVGRCAVVSVWPYWWWYCGIEEVEFVGVYSGRCCGGWVVFVVGFAGGVGVVIGGP